MNLDFRNTNALWCSVAAETLWRAGVRHAVISPGSRNTPLTMALVAHAGIVAGSEPEREFAETELKFQALLAALRG